MKLTRTERWQPMQTARSLSVIAWLLACSLALAAGCGQGAQTPGEAIGRLKAAASSNNYGAIWDLLTTETRIHAEIALERTALSIPSDEESQRVFGVNRDEMLAMSGRGRFIALLRTGHGGGRVAADAKDTRIQGDARYLDPDDRDHAVIVVRTGDEERELHLHREDGSWRIDGRVFCGALPARGDATAIPLACLLACMIVLRRRRT